jgi:RHS repeat-associated protein
VTNTGSVWVNQIIPYRTNNYFWEALPVTNGPGPVYQTVTTLAALTNGNPNNAWYGTTNIGHVFVPETPESYSYDLDGNLLSDGHWNYTWDGENRLIALTNNANIALAGQYALTFAYDYQGRRIQKLVCTNSGLAYVPEYTNRFVYDGWNLSAILNPGGSIAASFMWGTDLSGSMQGASGVGGLLAENLAGNGVQFVAYDGNGNVAALVNAATGAISANYEYGPFGEVVRANGPMAKLNPFMFSTKFYDWESGLYYYGFRYYNPSTGRWLSRDPLGELGGVNLYVIGCNIGPNGYDVLGQWSAWSIVSGVVQVISGGLQIYSGVGVVTGVMQVFQGCCSVFEGVTGTNPMVQFSSWVAQEAGVDPLTGARIYHGVEAFVGIASLKSCVGDIKLLVQGQREITETSDIVQWLPGKGWQGITYVKKRTVNASYAIRLWIAGKVVVDLHDAFETIDPPPDSGPEN